MEERTTRRSFLILMTTAVSACLLAAGKVFGQPEEDANDTAQRAMENVRIELDKLRSVLTGDDLEGAEKQMQAVRDELSKLRGVLATG